MCRTLLSRNRKGKLFVNRSSDRMMLQFMNEGLMIYLPDSSDLVDIKLAEFNTPVKLEVLDDRDVVLDSKTIDRDNSTEWLRLKGNGFSIDTVRLSGGGNEGSLVEICARVVQNP